MTAMARRSPRDPARRQRDEGAAAAQEPLFAKVRFGRSRRNVQVFAELRAIVGTIIPSRTPNQPNGIGPMRSRGQSILEFALVLPILMVLLGGAIQFGVIFAAKNSLAQIARDTARWAATQTFPQCTDAATGTPPPLLYEVDQIAQVSSLIGYSAGMWNAGNFTSYGSSSYTPPAPPATTPPPLPASPPNGEGVEVVWAYETGGACPPTNNLKPAYVTVRVTHAVPILLPGLQYLPGLGTCDGTGCHITLGSTSEFRMEPPRQ